VSFGLSISLEFSCTNNKVEYEALLCGLGHLWEMGVKCVNMFRDSRLVVQQVKRENQCLDGTLNEYHDMC
jgi:ribonuclease HI